MRRLKGVEANDFERVELPCTLKVRESTGPARHRLTPVAEAQTLKA